MSISDNNLKKLKEKMNELKSRINLDHLMQSSRPLLANYKKIKSIKPKIKVTEQKSINAHIQTIMKHSITLDQYLRIEDCHKYAMLAEKWKLSALESIDLYQMNSEEFKELIQYYATNELERHDIFEKNAKIPSNDEIEKIVNYLANHSKMPLEPSHLKKVFHDIFEAKQVLCSQINKRLTIFQKTSGTSAPK